MNAISAAHVADISDIGDVEWEQTLEMLLPQKEQSKKRMLNWHPLLHIFITF